MIVILLPLTILVLLLLLFYFAMKTSNFKKFYFTIVAIAGIIGMVVAYGMAAYQILMLNIISDQEYIQGSRYWEIQDCQYRTTAKPLVAPTDGQAVDMAPTEQEIDACEREATARAITSRKYNAKEVIIGGLVRGTIFLILYKLHYPHMVAEEPTTPDKPKRTTRKTPTRRRSTRKTVAKNS